MKHFSNKTKYIITFLTIIIVNYIIIPYFIKINIPLFPESTQVYDENNNYLGEIIYDKKYRRIKQSLEKYPKFLKKSVLAIEDKRFYQHNGIDYFALIRAFINNIQGYNTQGASTIESQVIRNHFWLNQKRNISLKIQEFFLALALNKRYTKNQIFETYLNDINFGYMNYGFESASKFYFGKNTSHLTKAEIIALISIFKNPNKYDPLKKKNDFQKRFEMLTNYLYKNQIITKNEKISIENEILTFQNEKVDGLPYIVDYLKNNYSLTGGMIQTTIDYHITKKVEELAKNSIKNMAWKNVSDYGILIVDRKTMKLKVMIGGNNYYTKEGQVNSTLALRQPGSSLKPHLYLLAFEKLGKNPSSTITDLPVSYPTKDGNIYQPKNYSLDYKGEVSLAEALSQSINIPAVKILNEIGVQNFLGFLKKIGIHSLTKESDYYGLSLALGSGEVNLYELLQSYSIYANYGQLCNISILLNEEKNCQKITEKKYTDMVYQILSNRYIKLPGFPINSNLDFNDREVFVKTGTSRNFNDNWAIGFTHNYMIGVWVGNKDGSEMKGVSGATGAGDIFRKIVYTLDETEVIPKISNQEKISKPYTKIISPLNKTVFKINHFVPIESQKVKLEFSSNIPHNNEKWYINGKLFLGDFFSILDLSAKNNIKVELYQNEKIVGSDEVWVYMKTEGEH